jgi:hypothetical protein
MTREARLMSGIILITVPTIQYGGYFLLTSLMSKGSGYMENPLRQNFFRAGHAHAGVIVTLAHLPNACGRGGAAHATCLVCSNRGATLCDSHLGGILLFGATADRHSSQRSRRPDLRRSRDSRPRGSHAWRRFAQVAHPA